MGRLIYRDKNQSFDVDDRILSHVRIVVMNKLRRREPFMLQLPSPTGVGSHSVWIHPSVPLMFHFYGGRPPQIDSELVETMMRSASSPDGLDVDTLLRN